MLFNSFISFFIIISHQYLFQFINAILLVDDKILIAFMKSHQETKLSKYPMQKYEAYLGIMYYMKMNWKCDKIEEEFKEYERTECQKYRKYLDILYEYLYREYVGIPTVKPKSVFKKDIEIEGPIIYLMKSLANISQFYFKSFWGMHYNYKLNKLFYNHFEPKLLNEERFNYGIKLENKPKLSINEMILQLAIEKANNYKTNESLDGIIQQKFDKNLQEMFKKADARAREWKANGINYDKHYIIFFSKFDDQHTWTEDAEFTEFVKGLATNFEKFLKLAKEYSNYLCRMKEKGNINKYNRRMISLGLNETEKMKKNLTQKYEAHLGVVYLMQKNWQCAKIGKKFNEYERNICQKYRKYLDILYEYLFRLYLEAKNPNVSKQLPPLVKPIFIIGQYPRSLIDDVKKLNEISKCFWQKGENELNKIYNTDFIYTMALVNEKDFKLRNERGKERGKCNKKRNGNKNCIISKEFERKIKKLYENTKENDKEEKVNLEQAKAETENDEERKTLIDDFNEKFGTFNSSPFS